MIRYVIIFTNTKRNYYNWQHNTICLSHLTYFQIEEKGHNFKKASNSKQLLSSKQLYSALSTKQCS